MKTEFKTRLLTHLLSKKNEGGFTLIELLVVIIIIGILSAVALPTFLNQANRARQTEAQQVVGSMNRGQQAYYLENADFAEDFDELAIGVTITTNDYQYSITSTDAFGTNVTNHAQPWKDFSVNPANAGVANNTASYFAYVGGVGIVVPAGALDANSIATLCEADEVLATNAGAGNGLTSVVPTATDVPCPNLYNRL